MTGREQLVVDVQEHGHARECEVRAQEELNDSLAIWRVAGYLACCLGAPTGMLLGWSRGADPCMGKVAECRVGDSGQ